MKIYTRAGDSGGTSLFGGGRVPKSHARVEAYGTVDELNAVLGQAIVQVGDPDIVGHLQAVQHDLFTLGSDLATPPAREGRDQPVTPTLPTDRVSRMEAWIDAADEELAPLRAFVLPGGSGGAAALHLARTVCRRAERRVVDLADAEPVGEQIVPYLNRLSDLLFTFARLENHRAGIPDVEWEKP
ncbi:MAG: cob(I)yrinic acid a,c-diamide adenosyltransferase [Gemmatimonadota bacterium]|nr:cob(I)yrinic acid a,c-diamide adenosyltransferase [Gemmatimonadota bacterium]